MYNDKYKIRLPKEVMADIKEATAKSTKKAATPKKRKRSLQPFTGKQPDPVIKEILASVQSPAN